MSSTAEPPSVGRGRGAPRGRLSRLPRARPGGHRVADTGHPGHRLPDRLDHQDVHRGRRRCSCGSRPGRPRRARRRLPARVPTVSRAGPSSGRRQFRHLLTHTAGSLRFCTPRDLSAVLGETVSGRRVPTLGRVLRRRPACLRRAGHRFTYTNHGFATWARSSTDVTGSRSIGYLREQIFDRSAWRTPNGSSGRMRTTLATGYDLGPAAQDRSAIRGVPAGAWRRVLHTQGHGPLPRGAARGGANEHGSICEPETLATMFEPHFRPDPRVAGHWSGVLPRRYRRPSRRRAPGESCPASTRRSSWLLTTALAVMAFANGARELRCCGCQVERLGCSSGLLGVPAAAIRTDIPQHPEIWGEICGRYYLPARLTDARAREMAGAGAKVFVRGGQLTLGS